MTPTQLLRKAQPPAVGLELTIRGIRWSAEWEFDCPTAIISPVYRFHEDGCSLEYAVESLMIDACIDGKWRDEGPLGWEWRGWTDTYLWNLFYHAKQRHAQRIIERVRFTLDEDGEMSWETLWSKEI